MKAFLRMTKLKDISGRADYISNPDRQENIVLKSDIIDWKQYQDFEKYNRKSSEPNNEGRELIIALPNKWADNIKILESRCQIISNKALGKSTDMQWAVHWNKAKTNLHMHIVFSERTMINKNPEKWDRDVYLTNDGRVARSKKDRAKFNDGNYKPPKHRKGDIKSGGFSDKDIKYKSKKWLQDTKITVITEIERRGWGIKNWGEKIEPPGLIAEIKEGRGKRAVKIAPINVLIRETNLAFDKYIASLPSGTLLSDEQRKELKSQAWQSINAGKAYTFNILPQLTLQEKTEPEREIKKVRPKVKFEKCSSLEELLSNAKKLQLAYEKIQYNSLTNKEHKKTNTELGRIRGEMTKLSKVANQEFGIKLNGKSEHDKIKSLTGIHRYEFKNIDGKIKAKPFEDGKGLISQAIKRKANEERNQNYEIIEERKGYVMKQTDDFIIIEEDIREIPVKQEMHKIQEPEWFKSMDNMRAAAQVEQERQATPQPQKRTWAELQADAKKKLEANNSQRVQQARPDRGR